MAASEECVSHLQITSHRGWTENEMKDLLVTNNGIICPAAMSRVLHTSTSCEKLISELIPSANINNIDGRLIISLSNVPFSIFILISFLALS
ncbi:hypothetical protein FRX31_013233 [Thalictrum thalictroides]|uniref:Uncharacterized protein n=1 Tax=Thalictrum thalictroides TaxID=46969 RepID=A0A7J6WJN4_THATH|nr:hypothetical protein FRX31_013233 [Thalictrum thalictroides]